MANEFKHKDPGSQLTQAEFIASDGTGHIFDSQAAGDVLYASSTTVLARLAKATDGNILELASGLPAWTASPTIGSTSWANANHAHAASNSGGTLTTLGTVTTGVWQGTAIASGYIAANAITEAKIADDAINSEHYTDASIDNAHLADDAVDSDELAAGAVDIAHLSASGTASSSTFLRGDNSWVAAGGIASVAADTTPQVGGSAGFDLQAQLLVGNGGTTGIAISANGEVTMAKQPAFLAINGSRNDNGTGDGTSFTVEFNSQIEDFGGNYNESTDTLPAPVTGLYQINVAVLVGGFGGTHDMYTIILDTVNRDYMSRMQRTNDMGGWGDFKYLCSR